MDFFDKLPGGSLTRAPQPNSVYGLAPGVLEQLEALELDPERPVLAVDADEVLVYFARHLARFAETIGFRLSLTEYRLNGAFTRLADGGVAGGDEVGRVLRAFFDEETGKQEVVEGAREALAALSRAAQVIVLTNVPQAARAARIDNLRGHGLDYPLVANSGGKGRPLRWLWDRTRASVAFIDDSASQLGSAERRAPEVFRTHFVADPDLRRLAGVVSCAQARPESWESAAAVLGDHLRGRSTGG